MKASRFISAGTGFKSVISTVAVTVSFVVIIVSLSVTEGFRREIYAALRSVSGDISVPSDTLVSGLDDMEGLRKIDGVLYLAGIVKSGDEICGVMFKGDDRKDSVALGAGIPSSLASRLNLSVGDRMTAYFVGDKVRARNFEVTEVYPSPFESEETQIVRVGIGDLRRAGGYGENAVTAVELTLDNDSYDRENLRERALEASVRTGVLSQPVSDTFRNIFDWLDLINVNVVAILVLMILVAGFNMISGLLIMLFRNIPVIGILKTLGMSDKAIAATFLRVASRVVLIGMAAGNVIGAGLCLIQKYTHLLKLDPANYFLSFVPVEVNPLSILMCDAAAYAGIMLLLLIPSLFISGVEPAKTVEF